MSSVILIKTRMPFPSEMCEIRLQLLTDGTKCLRNVLATSLLGRISLDCYLLTVQVPPLNIWRRIRIFRANPFKWFDIGLYLIHLTHREEKQPETRHSLDRSLNDLVAFTMHRDRKWLSRKKWENTAAHLRVILTRTQNKVQPYYLRIWLFHIHVAF